MSHTEEQNAVLLDLLRIAEFEGVQIWFYGGYGLDALERATVREHKDIDVCVESVNHLRIRDRLVDSGFELVEAGAHFSHFTKAGQGVEMLTFERWPDGQLVTDTGETGAFPWPGNSLPDEPNGVLLGRPVRAMSYDALYVCKAGFTRYDPSQPLREKDEADLRLIASRLSPTRLAELEAFFDPVPGTRQHYPSQGR